MSKFKTTTKTKQTFPPKTNIMSAKRTQKVTRGNPKKARMAATPPDAIFALNDDCLTEVFRFLAIQDVFKVFLTDRRFGNSVRLRFSFGGVDRIDPEFIKSCPNDLWNDFLESFGRTAKSIKLKLLPEKEFLRVIAHFHQLEDLILSEIKITDEEAAKVLPRALKSLEIDRSSIDETVLQEWIPHLNPSLTHLRFVDRKHPMLMSALSNLHNITSLLVDGPTEPYPDVIAELIGNNKDHLTELTIVSRKGNIPEEIWNKIIQLDKLTHLQLDQLLYDGTIPPGIRLFPALTSLQVNFYLDALLPFLEHLACQDTLQSVVMDDFDARVPVSMFKRFKNLRNLELHQTDWTGSGSDVIDCGQLKQLHTLVLNGGVFNHTRDVFELVPKMPWLKKLMLGNVMFFQKNVDVDDVERKFARLCKRRKQQPFEFEIGVAEP